MTHLKTELAFDWRIVDKFCKKITEENSFWCASMVLACRWRTDCLKVFVSHCSCWRIARIFSLNLFHNYHCHICLHTLVTLSACMWYVSIGNHVSACYLMWLLMTKLLATKECKFSIWEKTYMSSFQIEQKAHAICAHLGLCSANKTTPRSQLLQNPNRARITSYTYYFTSENKYGFHFHVSCRM